MQRSLTSVKMTPDPPEETRPAQGWSWVWGVSLADLDSPDSLLRSWVLAAVILIFILMGRNDVKWSSLTLTESCSGSHVRGWELRLKSQAEKTKTLNHERNCQHEFPSHNRNIKHKPHFNFPCFLERCTLHNGGSGLQLFDHLDRFLITTSHKFCSGHGWQ